MRRHNQIQITNIDLPGDKFFHVGYAKCPKCEHPNHVVIPNGTKMATLKTDTACVHADMAVSTGWGIAVHFWWEDQDETMV